VINLKNKIITIAAVLAVMVAMTGIAVGAGIAFVNDPKITIDVLETGTHLVSVSAPTIKNLTINGINYTTPDGTKYTTPYNPCDKFNVTIDGLTSTTCFVEGTWSNNKEFMINYTHNKGAANGDYEVEYIANYDLTSPTGMILAVSAKADINAIPEFPTIALPVAAVIGLMFYFHNRKRK
jgi:hypothetical protein